jgi:hypothetical protein
MSDLNMLIQNTLTTSWQLQHFPPTLPGLQGSQPQGNQVFHAQGHHLTHAPHKGCNAYFESCLSYLLRCLSLSPCTNIT